MRDYVLDNVRMWLEEFHFDGLRLDAVHAIFDLGARHILRAIEEVAEDVAVRRGWPATIVAESDLNDPRVALPARARRPRRWTRSGPTTSITPRTPSSPASATGYYADFGEPGQLARALERPVPVRLGLQPVPGPQARGAAGGPRRRPLRRLPPEPRPGRQPRPAATGSTALLGSPAKQRLAAGLLLLSPYLPLLFMGEEYGEENPFPFFCSFGDPELVEAVREGRKKEFEAFTWQGEVPDPQGEETFASAKLSWSWPEGTHRAGLRRLYRDLLAARREWPALRDFEQPIGAAAGRRRETPARCWSWSAATSRRASRSGRSSTSATGRPGSRRMSPAGRSVLFRSEAAEYGGERREAGPATSWPRSSSLSWAPLPGGLSLVENGLSAVTAGPAGRRPIATPDRPSSRREARGGRIA